MQFKLSPSALNLFNECSRCFWLVKHGVWKRPPGIFPSLPSGMDGILKTHFDNFMTKGELPPELKETECNKFKLFDDEDKLKIWRNNFQGVRWVNPEGHTLFGAVDNILVKNDGVLIVLDYKTRGYKIKEEPKEYAKKYYQNQMNMYTFLLQKEGHKTENYAIILFYYPKEVTPTGEVIFDTEFVKIEANVKDAENLFNDAIDILNNKCPTQTCEWCEKV